MKVGLAALAVSGGGFDFGVRGQTCKGAPTHLPLNSGFSSNFGHFVLENSKIYLFFFVLKKKI